MSCADPVRGWVGKPYLTELGKVCRLSDNDSLEAVDDRL